MSKTVDFTHHSRTEVPSPNMDTINALTWRIYKYKWYYEDKFSYFTTVFIVITSAGGHIWPSITVLHSLGELASEIHILCTCRFDQLLLSSHDSDTYCCDSWWFVGSLSKIFLAYFVNRPVLQYDVKYCSVAEHSKKSTDFQVSIRYYLNRYLHADVRKYFDHIFS